MRIAWVLYGSLAAKTGGTIYDAHVVEGLRRRAHVVHEVSLVSESRATANAYLEASLEALECDVVVGDELCFRALGPAFRALRDARSRAARVLLVHHLTAWEQEISKVQQRLAWGRELRALEASTHIVTTSRTTKTRLLAEGVPLDADKLAVVLPGCDRLAPWTPFATSLGPMQQSVPRANANANANAVRFVFLGAIVPRKRVLELVQALSLVQSRARNAEGARPRMTLRLVGSTTRDVAYTERVRAAVLRLGLRAHVDFTGEVDEHAVACELAQADALVMPSSLEGYGIAATEAIFAGLPVIAARTEGLEEALERCPGACLFADTCTDALAANLEAFATNDALRLSMRLAAQEARPRLPTWESCTNDFESVLHAALGNS